MNIDGLTWHVTDELESPATEAIGEGLNVANFAAASLQDVRPLLCFARAASGEVIGGARARTWGQWAELQQLWVDVAHRRRGVGSKLIHLFEARAIERGCHVFYLETFSFQASELYLSLGYSVLADISGFPDGTNMSLMSKTLSSAN